jgi:hypothetical protein
MGARASTDFTSTTTEPEPVNQGDSRIPDECPYIPTATGVHAQREYHEPLTPGTNIADMPTPTNQDQERDEPPSLRQSQIA